MCGITGVVNSNFRKPQSSILKKMTAAISYRGPDDQGLEIADACALGNRRLAVIDLSSKAHQPMWDSRKRFCLTFNGEIYNFKQLKKELQRKGYQFFSESDTEVILNLYKEYDSACVEKLSGMFAFALWDKQKQLLFLARDHFGIKPLYYYWKDNLFIFASEIKSILIHPRVKKELNLIALSQYFSVGFGTIPSPNSIFRDIYKLPPASFAILKDDKLTVKKYWHLEKTRLCELSFPEASKKLKALLAQSVKDQLVSDVPLGGFLSGGIDSSTLVALMKQYHSFGVKTFSIGFSDPNFDESKYALRVANLLKTNHFTKTFSIREHLNILPEVVKKLDEPLADASILPMFLLCRFARQQVTVALSGDGGDELFAGYPTYFAHQAARLASFFPYDWLKKSAPLALPLADFLPLMEHSQNLPSQFKLKRFIFGLDRNIGRQYLNFLGPIDLEQKSNLFTQPVVKAIGSQDPAVQFIDKLLKEARLFERQKKLQYLDLRAYLAEDCLVKTDRASSFNSLEVRVPFLTPVLAEFAFSLPGNFHFNGFTLKRLLKAAVKDLLPQEIINRPKKGFGVPISQWLNKELKPMTDRLLAEKRLKRQGLFEPIFVQRLIGEHRSKKESHHMVLWGLLMFQLWYDQWFK